MSIPRHRASFSVTSAPRARRAFALLITITLLAFLVLLIVGLSSFTRVETQVSSNGQGLVQARSNALLALNVALGDLQRLTGPDQRVTATADIGDGVSNQLPVPSDGTRHWTGVWGNGNSSTATSSSPVFLDWLVSGNSNTTVTANADGSIASAAATPAFTPDKTVSGLANGTTALSTGVTVGGTSARLLVGPNSVGNSTTGGLGTAGYVVAPVVQITAAAGSVPGLGASATPVVGDYAWWVGDEGVKARADLVESEASIASTDTDSQRLRYRAPARDGVELMTNAPAAFASADMEAASTSSLRAELRNIIAVRQLPLASSGTPFPTTFLQKGFYDLSNTSEGVLSNTLAGGLRLDLTAAFAPGTTNTTAPTGPIWQVTPSSGGVTDYDKSADWQLLRSYYQLPFSNNVSGSGTSMSFSQPQAQVDGTTNTQPAAAQQGIFPVVAFWQLVVEAKVVNASMSGCGVQLCYYPAVVLWNPYNVTLKDQTYHVTYSLSGGDVTFVRVFKNPTTTAYYVPATGNANLQASTPWSSNGLPVVKVAVASGDMAPGAAYVYTLPGNGSYSGTDFGTYNTLKPGWFGGGTNAITVNGGQQASQNTALFLLSGGGDASSYSVSFWRGTQNSGGLSIVPPFGMATNSTASNGVSGGTNTWNSSLGTVPTSIPTSSGATEPAARDDNLILADSSDNVLQTITQNNNYNDTFKLRWAYASFLNQPLTSGGSARGNFTIGYTGNSWALKTSNAPLATTFSTPSSSHPENYPVRWLADYNPRAPYAGRSPYEQQSTYFWSNPNYYSKTNTIYGAGDFVPVNVNATIPYDTNTNQAYVGMAVDGGTTPPSVVLFNVPRALSLNGVSLGESVVSLGEFQHAQLYRVDGQSTFASNASPAYAFGNSLAQPRGSLSAPYLSWSGINASTTGANVYDDSYLLNRAIWDGYFLSTVPRNEAATGAGSFSALPNPRMIFHDRAGATLPGDLLDAQKSAATLLLNGAFNVNSTSVNAWTALIGGLCNVPVGANKLTGDSPYPRLSYPYNDTDVLDTTSTTDAASEANSYQGYRSLTAAQIQALATQIVVQVRRRGPFVSLADFINRSLAAGSVSGVDNRLMGALAQAISDSGLNSAFSSSQQAVLPSAAGAAAMVTAAAAGATATGVPGWITQADLLQPLGPSLSARSDTFVIRTYGDVQNPVTGVVTGRAWCEAVVQRLPEYSSTANNPWDTLASLNAQNLAFGRRYKVVSFRWLTPDDI